MQFETSLNEKSHEVTFSDDLSTASVNGSRYQIEFTTQANGRRLMRIGTRLYRIDNLQIDGQEVTFTLNGRWHTVTVKDEQELLLERLGFKTAAASSAGMVNAPMPGKILEVMVDEEQEVEQGDPVIILEAMKMENELKAPSSGVVSSVMIEAGNSVEKNQPLLEIEPRG